MLISTSASGTSPTSLNKMENKIIDIFAAACAAQRINGEYVKYQVDERKPNRSLMIDLLNAKDRITTEDQELAQKVLNHFQSLTYKVLSGSKLNSFEKVVSKLVYQESSNYIYDLSIIAPLPSTYQRESAKNEVQNRISFANGGYLGDVGSKVIVESSEVLKCMFSVNFKVYFITCINNKDQVFFFSRKEPIQLGTIIQVSGTIKAHRENCTQLSRAKVI